MVWIIKYREEELDGEMGFFHTIEETKRIAIELKRQGAKTQIMEVARLSPKRGSAR